MCRLPSFPINKDVKKPITNGWYFETAPQEIMDLRESELAVTLVIAIHTLVVPSCLISSGL